MKIAPSLLALTLLLPVAPLARGQDKAADTARTQTYRITYTLTEMEGTKKIGAQRASMVLNSSSGNSTIKLGSRVPIATGSYTASSGVQTQFTYLDVGLNIKTSVNQLPNGFEVLSMVEQSSLADQPVGAQQQPIVRQTMLQNSLVLTIGKPLLIGSLDIPGSTRRTDVEILLEKVP